MAQFRRLEAFADQETRDRVGRVRGVRAVVGVIPRFFRVPVVGSDEHFAVDGLDRLDDLADRHVVIVGDITHSRVARSNVLLLTTLGARVTLVAPPTLMPSGVGSGACGRSGNTTLP